jgi:hypothetical protein
MITKDQIDSTFNSAYAAKQFVVIEEMSKNAKRDLAQISMNKLKTLITEEKLVVNRKHQPEYTIDNHVNIMINSNHADAMLLEEGDRRFAVFDIDPIENRIGNTDYWTGLAEWIKDNVGSIYDYLLSYDTTGFSPNARAPLTSTKKEMVESSYSDEQILAQSIKDNPEQVFKSLGFKNPLHYVVASRLLEAHWALMGRLTKPDQTKRIQFGLALKELFGPSQQIRAESGPKVRIYKVVKGEWDMEKAKEDLKLLLK